MKTSTLTILLTRNTKSQQVYTIPNVSRPCVCWAPSPIHLGSNLRCINVNYTNFLAFKVINFSNINKFENNLTNVKSI
jgi:hypothetical protein